MVASVVLHFNEMCWDIVLGHGHDDGIIADRTATLNMQIKPRFLESEEETYSFILTAWIKRFQHMLDGWTISCLETVARFCLLSYTLAARLRSDFLTHVFTEERASVMEDSMDLNRYIYDCEQCVW